MFTGDETDVVQKVNDFKYLSSQIKMDQIDLIKIGQILS